MTPVSPSDDRRSLSYLPHRRLSSIRRIPADAGSVAGKNAGRELAPAPGCGPGGSHAQAGCCGVFGPSPSATLDKILTRLSAHTGVWVGERIEDRPGRGNRNREKSQES